MELKRDRIKNLLSDGVPDSQVTVCGWVRSKRVSKAVAFLAVNDGSCQEVFQLIVDASSAVFDLLEQISTGAAISAKGILKESPGQGQAFELHVEDLEVLGTAPPRLSLAEEGALYGVFAGDRSLAASH